ncbi:glyoxalase/bleomycin resistance/extradiol dioxygenase family protein [Halalkalibacterium halodurans]|uniref:BH0850 protein n=1 Tax=Halalkalibacterium halodurans (strain ATCC BAA-125 / DSM 18197 / FERM 7344 / JCM 9153 / C-125) TaxID=272558 RepID=Q9KEK2_HALH5|nr:glyoxalase/bleomycin resistance/extradiol dioxygenase family protein [Halalkalibacterium halodurans]MED4080786.1 glyoxalase/bleomycin resistance/extradiol dioxygenase family protein [Halalkalibacterium halodurans]MED4086243.1 glyoxalase/bleomycin resistance/extradiol dioxygenase family protein [Halalkalibacterium halodurans]MED4106925.1 glyoxalase/bleomycin resistance/extradiol dioxygenase family protein [Halalkalibacterium halodurans]MED4110264.1 glyoxalase/bleomycin resistance/extradiol di
MILTMNPYLMLDGDGQAAIEFYQDALNAEVITIQTYGDLPEQPNSPMASVNKDLILHAHLKLGEMDLMISDQCLDVDPERFPQHSGSPVTIALTTNNVEMTTEVFQKLASGGEEIAPLEKTFFSPLYGQVTDKFGITWHVSTQEESFN